SLVVFDPLYTHLALNTDAHNDQKVKHLLAQLTEVAESENVAILGLRHLTKRKDDPLLYRGGGSIGFVGTARAGVMLQEDEKDSDCRILLQTKNNLALKQKPQRWRLAEDKTREVAKLVFVEETDAEEVFSSGKETTSKLDLAKQFLTLTLQKGPVLS